MSFSRPFQGYHSHADPIWPDGTFNLKPKYTKFFVVPSTRWSQWSLRRHAPSPTSSRPAPPSSLSKSTRTSPTRSPPQPPQQQAGRGRPQQQQAHQQQQQTLPPRRQQHWPRWRRSSARFRTRLVGSMVFFLLLYFFATDNLNKNNSQVPNQVWSIVFFYFCIFLATDNLKKITKVLIKEAAVC